MNRHTQRNNKSEVYNTVFSLICFSLLLENEKKFHRYSTQEPVFWL